MDVVVEVFVSVILVKTIKIMKTYLVTSENLEALQKLFPDLGKGLTVSRIIEDWVETLIPQ